MITIQGKGGQPMRNTSTHSSLYSMLACLRKLLQHLVQPIIIPGFCILVTRNRGAMQPSQVSRSIKPSTAPNSIRNDNSTIMGRSEINVTQINRAANTKSTHSSWQKEQGSFQTWDFTIKYGREEISDNGIMESLQHGPTVTDYPLHVGPLELERLNHCWKSILGWLPRCPS